MKQQQLPPSELILNEDQSIYHLHLHPHEVADTIITVGDPERVRMVTAHFDHIEVEKSHREFATQTGTYRNKRITVISTGIGTDNVDIVLNELDALVNIDLGTRMVKNEQTSLNFIRLGTSGALQSHIDLGTWLISDSAFGYDGLLPFYGHLKSDQSECDRLQHHLNGLPLPYRASASKELIAHFDDRVYEHGHTLTMAGFYAPQGRAIRIANPTAERFEHFADFKMKNGDILTNLEMETAGIYGLAEVLGHRAISISALLANRMNGEFHPEPGRVVEDMVAHSLEVISRL